MGFGSGTGYSEDIEGDRKNGAYPYPFVEEDVHEKVLSIPEDKFYGTQERDQFNIYSLSMHEKYPGIVTDGADMPEKEGVDLRIIAPSAEVLEELVNETIKIFRLKEN